MTKKRPVHAVNHEHGTDIIYPSVKDAAMAQRVSIIQMMSWLRQGKTIKQGSHRYWRFRYAPQKSPLSQTSQKSPLSVNTKANEFFEPIPDPRSKNYNKNDLTS